MGQYSFPFSFVLASGMPGTFVKEYKAHDENCFAKTKYKLTVGMKGSNSNRALYTKLGFVVDQQWELPSGPQSREFTGKLKGYCYSNLGSFHLNCHFDKDKFIVGDTSSLSIAVDNSQCKSDVKSFRCELVQETRLQTTNNAQHDLVRRMVTSVALPGLPAGARKAGLEALRVLLPIHTPSNLEASSNGNLIRNEFKVIITAEMASCLCNAQPSNQIDVKVFNRPISQVPFQPQVPNWNPTVMSPYVCTIAPQTRMNQDFKNQAYPTPGTQYLHL